MNTHVRFERNPGQLSYRLLVARYREDSTTANYLLVTPEGLVFVPVESGAEFPHPPFEVAPELVVPILDAILEAGFKPSRADFKDGELQATKRHLEDLRALIHVPAGESLAG